MFHKISVVMAIMPNKPTMTLSIVHSMGQPNYADISFLDRF